MLKSQYEILGFEFDYHRHGKGPFHYASEFNDFVFEIYPLTKSMTKADGSLRLGFSFENLQEIMDKVKNSNWEIISDVKENEWGISALVKDLDARKVELKQK